MSGWPQAAPPPRGPLLKVAVEAPPAGWDPHVDLDAASRRHWEHIYESLVQLGPRLEVEPALAESWAQPDPRTYVFRLRRSVQFQHAREVVAEDVKYSFERARRLGAAAVGGALEGLESVEVLDRHTVKLTLAAPDPALLLRLASNRGSSIVPREIVERHGGLKAVMVGTGPFRIKKYEPGRYAELEWNQRYWAKDLPRSNGVLLLVMKEEATRLGELRRGAIDLASVGDPRLADQAAAEPGLRIQSPPAARRVELWLQQERPPFRTKKLRQALSAALDREHVIAAVLPGRGVLTSAFPPISPYAPGTEAAASLPLSRRDVARARRLLAEAGHSRGFAITAVVAEDRPDLVATARAAQAGWKELGIAVTVEPTEPTALARRWRAGDFQALLRATDWSPDPDGYVRSPLRSTSGENGARYRNALVDRLLDEGRLGADARARLAAWRKLEIVLADDVPALWLMARPAGFELMRATLAGYAARPDLSLVNLKYAFRPG
jgi:peptide/nickel transport system substrate-binding protein